MSACLICDGQTSEHARAKVRQKYTATFLRCRDCGFIFIPDPTWLAEAYAEPINQSDTGYVSRNLWAREKVRHVIETSLNPTGTFLDYAAGYGLFVRMMRDIGYDFRWSDLYCQNLFVRGFEAPQPLTGSFEAATAFEVFEHLMYPREEMQKLSKVTSCLIFTTTIIPKPAPPLEDWWYYGLGHGQHLSFYTVKSLEAFARQFDYRLTTNGTDLHVFSRKALSAKILSPSTTLWQRFWRRLNRETNRPSLTMTDHDFIVDLLNRKNR